MVHAVDFGPPHLELGNCSSSSLATARDSSWVKELAVEEGCFASLATIYHFVQTELQAFVVVGNSLGHSVVL